MLIERGTVTDWARLTAAIRRDPWGPVARQVEEYVGYARSDGVTELLARAVTTARARAEREERTQVAARVRDLLEASGLSAAEFAARIGTSRSRLSTYRSGRVVPAATLLVRMERVAHRARRARRQR
ncbi:MAG: helix-turn-helix domain-containing protein [Pseudonocardia sp.]|nr:helix-turn-helix domain-containing protein [Pseudonocardia sp.]